MSTRLELHLLGKLRVAVDGRAHTDSLSAKAQAMLCYLAITGEAHSRSAPGRATMGFGALQVFNDQHQGSDQLAPL